MSDKEARCFKLVRHWERRRQLKQLRTTLIPRLPLSLEIRTKPFMTQAIYYLVLLITLPLTLLLYLTRLVYAVLMFPLTFVTTYAIPSDLRAPGERNIQGVFHVFSRYMDFPAEFEVACINDWVSTLYGRPKQQEHLMEKYIDNEKDQNQHQGLVPDSNYAEFILNTARERLSRELGNYA